VAQRSRQDLDWQAFLYLSGEMSPSEAAAFECLLAEDQEAREAVASGAGLMGAVTAASGSVAEPPAPLPAQTAGRHLPKLVAATAIAALLFVGASLFLARHGASPTQELSDDRLPDLNAVELRDFLAHWDDSARSIWNGGDEEDEEVERVAPGDESDALDVPGWMLAAVESGREQSVEEN
jgi:hypothetical protein